MKFKSNSSSSFEILFLKNFDIIFSMFLPITNPNTMQKKKTLSKQKIINIIFDLRYVFYYEDYFQVFKNYI